MQLNLACRQFLKAVTFLGLVCVLPTAADTSGKTLPISQTTQQESLQTLKNQEPFEKTKQEIASSSDEEDSANEGPNDPLEPLNRLFFAINELVDFVVIRPLAEMYRAITPEPVRHGVTNVLDNLFAPVVFLNHVLQGEPERATVTLFRFIMNSTFGVAGLVNVSSDLDYPRYDTSFNQTLMTWGVETGPYLVLPLIGSSSFRGGIGIAADYFADPLNLYLNNRHHHKYHYWLTVRYGLDIVNQREKVIETIDNLRKGSLDMYVTMRSIYFQRQAYLAEKMKSENTQQ